MRKKRCLMETRKVEFVCDRPLLFVLIYSGDDDLRLPAFVGKLGEDVTAWAPISEPEEMEHDEL